MLGRLINRGIRQLLRSLQYIRSIVLRWQTLFTSGGQLHQLPVWMLILWEHPLCILHLYRNRNRQQLHPRAILSEKVLLAILYYLLYWILFFSKHDFSSTSSVGDRVRYVGPAQPSSLPQRYIDCKYYSCLQMYPMLVPYFLRLLHYYHQNFVPVGNACFSTARKFIISGIRVSGTDNLCLKFCIKWIFNDLCHSIGMSSDERYFMVLYSLCGMN